MTRQRPRDSQRSKVYAWERCLKNRAYDCATCGRGQHEHGRFVVALNEPGRGHYEQDIAHEFVAPDAYKRMVENYSLDECEALVREVRTAYGKPMVHVNDGRRRTSAAWNSYQRTIKLPRAMRSRWVVLHETAHSLCPEDVWHGPEFVRIYIDLLARYCGVPASEARALATKMRVKVGKSTRLPERLPRATLKRLADIEKQKATLKAEYDRLNKAAAKLFDQIDGLNEESYRLRNVRKKAA